MTNLDMLWTKFKLEVVLGFLVNLDKTNECALGLLAEVRALITESKAIADSLSQKAWMPSICRTLIQALPLEMFRYCFLCEFS